MATTRDFVTRYGVTVQGNTTVTTSTTTGALQVAGGAAIAKNLIVGTSADIWSTLTVQGPSNLNNNVSISGTLGVSGTSTLAAVTASGSLYVAGLTTLVSTATLNSGLTVAGLSTFNGATVHNGVNTFNGSTFVTGTNILTVGTGTTTLGGALAVAGNATFNSTTEAATTPAGAVVVSGGAYVGKRLIVASTDTNTTTNTSNALYVAGGAWIDRNFIVGGDTTFRGNVTFNGTQTNVYSTNTVYTDNLLNLHTPPGSVGTTHTWSVDDGKDIGFMFHYYKTNDKDAFLGLSNGSSFLEFYSESTETTAGVVTPVVYGTFRTGAIRLVGGTANSGSTSSGDLQVLGGVGVGDKIYAAGDISGGTLTGRGLTQGRVVFVGASGVLTDDAGLTYNASTDLLTGTITSANSSTHIKGGTAGQLVYQSAPDTTAFVSTGTSGFILQSNGTAAPSWVPLSGVSAGLATTASNIAAGTAGQVPYQTGPGQTNFFGPGTAGQLLISGGTSGPSYINTGSVYVGTAINADRVKGGDTGSLLIQSSTGTTAFVPIGSAGSILQSTGSTASWVTTGSLYVSRAVNADKWTTARTVTFTGDTTGTFTIDGSADVTNVALTIQPNSVALGTDTTGDYVSNGATSGFGISGSTTGETQTFTVTVNSTSSNTSSTIVFRDASGNFSANTITANLTGIASSATTHIINNDTSTTTTHYLTFVSASSGYQQLKVDATDLTFVPSAGRLGLGNAAPASKLDVTGDVRISGLTTVTNSTAVSTTNSGAFQVIGGVGVGGGLVVGGLSTVTNTTDASSITSGALQVLGGVGISKKLYVGSDITVGSTVANQVVPAIYSNNVLLASYTSPTISSLATVNLDQYAIASFRTAKYAVQIVDGSAVHATEILVTHNGTTAYINEYGIVTSGSQLGTFDAITTSSNIVLQFTPTTATSMVIKVVRFGITA